MRRSLVPNSQKNYRNLAILVIAVLYALMIGLPSGVAVLTSSTPHAPILQSIHSSDASHSVRVYELATGTVVTVPLDDYLANVLAAELSPNAPADVLMAAAVAARSYVAYVQSGARGVVGTIAHQHGADVTDSGFLDLPWLTVAEQAQKFRANAPADEARLQAAVAQTDGLILQYAKEPVLALTTALSTGSTRDPAHLLQVNLPYLKAIACPDDLTATNLHQVFSFTGTGLSTRLALPRPETLPNRFRIAAVGADGYVSVVTDGARSWTGDDFARRLSLPSSHFTLSASGDVLVVHTAGIGSGFGMSLHEAQVLARRGEGWRTLLATFYPGTHITKIG